MSGQDCCHPHSSHWRPRERTDPSEEPLLQALSPRRAEKGLAKGTCSAEERKGVDPPCRAGPIWHAGHSSCLDRTAGRQLQTQGPAGPLQTPLAERQGAEDQAGPTLSPRGSPSP